MRSTDGATGCMPEISEQTFMGTIDELMRQMTQMEVGDQPSKG